MKYDDKSALLFLNYGVKKMDMKHVDDIIVKLSFDLLDMECHQLCFILFNIKATFC